MTHNYKYIITGAGAAGLSLVYKLIKSGLLNKDRLLIIDKDDKASNDRTFCFWETGKSDWEEIVFRSWSQAEFKSADFQKSFPLSPYTYKMIKGIDFYNYVKTEINNTENIDWVKEEVLDIKEDVVSTDLNSYSGTYIFNSILKLKEVLDDRKSNTIYQHFLGWVIQTDTPFWNKDTITFMDFDIPQKGNTRFMYVLPFSENEALVEYTLFSEEVLNREAYEAALMDYLKDKIPGEYKIKEQERGVILMTDYKFQIENPLNKRVINIGTAGGQTKASSGFTFYFIQKLTDHIVKNLKNGKVPLEAWKRRNRFKYYDALLLDILKRENEVGSHIFANLFQKNKPHTILKFLNEESSLKEDFLIITKSDRLRFMKSIWNQI